MKKTYFINCSVCGSYEWTRNPPRQFSFMRCRGCRKQLGDFEVDEKESMLRHKARIEKNYEKHIICWWNLE